VGCKAVGRRARGGGAAQRWLEEARGRAQGVGEEEEEEEEGRVGVAAGRRQGQERARARSWRKDWVGGGIKGREVL
jgi:hypothetical protein